MKFLHHHLHLKRGATLIETLVYLVLFGITSVVIVNALLLSIQSFKELRMLRLLVHGGTVAFDRIIREVKDAESVDVGTSVLGADPSTLVLTSSHNDISRTVEISVGNDERIHVEVNGVDEGVLLPSGVTVERFVVRSSTNVSNIDEAYALSTLVWFEVELVARVGVNERHETFRTGSVIRGSY